MNKQLTTMITHRTAVRHIILNSESFCSERD